MHWLLTSFVVFSLLGGSRVHAQAEPSPSAAPDPAAGAEAEQGSGSTPESGEAAGAEAAPEPATAPPLPSQAPRAEPPPPPVRDFPVPDNTPPPKPDFDAPRFPDPNRPGRHSVETGFHLGVPIFVTAEADVDPGFAMAARLGFVAGPVVPEFHIGWQANGVDGEEILDAMWLGFGARLRMENHSAATPFLAASLDMNLWHYSANDTITCRYYCREREHRGFSPGLSAMAGVAVAVSRRVAFDFGARFGVTFASGILDQTEAWITPLVGMGFYYD